MPVKGQRKRRRLVVCETGEVKVEGARRPWWSHVRRMWRVQMAEK